MSICSKVKLISRLGCASGKPNCLASMFGVVFKLLAIVLLFFKSGTRLPAGDLLLLGEPAQPLR